MVSLQMSVCLINLTFPACGASNEGGTVWHCGIAVEVPRLVLPAHILCIGVQGVGVTARGPTVSTGRGGHRAATRARGEAG
jgi:hypothetical protein